MLLSLIISYAAARRFRRKLHIFSLVLTAVALISFFSAGVPHYYFVAATSQPFEASGVRFDAVLPLSFPLYAQLTSVTPDTSLTYEFYQLDFFTLMFHEYWVAFISPGRITLYLSWFSYILYLSLFLTVNAAGAVIGYLVSKKSFRNQVRTAVKPVRNLTVTLTTTALLMFSLYSFYSAYQLWSRFEWALEAQTHSFPFISGILSTITLAVTQYISLFPLYFSIGLVPLTLAFTLIIIALKPKIRVFLLATVLLVSSVFLFFEAYKIWEIYQWASFPRAAPLWYFDSFLEEATYAYSTYFPLYLQLGLMTTAAGLILITIGLRLRRRQRQTNTPLYQH